MTGFGTKDTVWDLRSSTTNNPSFFQFSKVRLQGRDGEGCVCDKGHGVELNDQLHHVLLRVLYCIMYSFIY